jgi:hypothetical protein
VNRRKVANFEKKFPITIKGVEVSESGSDPSSIRHGLVQLRYATPAFLKDELEFEINNTGEDTPLIVFARVLISNAAIRVFNTGITVDKVENSNSLEDVSEEFKTIITVSGHGPDYTEHFGRTFNKEFAQDTSESVIRLSGRLTSAGKIMQKGEAPVALIEELTEGDRHLRRTISDQSFVCTVEGLTGFVNEMKALCDSLYAERQFDENPKQE